MTSHPDRCSSYGKASKMAFAPKKDGGPNVKFFESGETAQLFETVKTWLNKNCKKVKIKKNGFSNRNVCRAFTDDATVRCCCTGTLCSHFQIFVHAVRSNGTTHCQRISCYRRPVDSLPRRCSGQECHQTPIDPPPRQVFPGLPSERRTLPHLGHRLQVIILDHIDRQKIESSD